MRARARRIAGTCVAALVAAATAIAPGAAGAPAAPWARAVVAPANGSGFPTPSVQEADPDSILERAAGRYRGIDAFCASFVQERIVPLLNQTTRSEGTLCQMHPAYFLMDFSDPEGDRVVADGRDLWLYYPSMNPDQVMRSRLGGSGGTFDFHGEFLEDPADRFDATYEGTETVTGRPTHRLTLRPADPTEDRGYERARLWIDREEGLIRKVEILEENESVRRVTLSDIRLNPDLDPSRFEFTPDPDMHVIDRTFDAPRP